MVSNSFQNFVFMILSKLFTATRCHTGASNGQSFEVILTWIQITWTGQTHHRCTFQTDRHIDHQLTHCVFQTKVSPSKNRRSIRRGWSQWRAGVTRVTCLTLRAHTCLINTAGVTVSITELQRDRGATQTPETDTREGGGVQLSVSLSWKKDSNQTQFKKAAFIWQRYISHGSRVHSVVIEWRETVWSLWARSVRPVPYRLIWAEINNYKSRDQLHSPRQNTSSWSAASVERMRSDSQTTKSRNKK